MRRRRRIPGPSRSRPAHADQDSGGAPASPTGAFHPTPPPPPPAARSVKAEKARARRAACRRGPAVKPRRVRAVTARRAEAGASPHRAAPWCAPSAEGAASVGPLVVAPGPAGAWGALAGACGAGGCPAGSGGGAVRHPEDGASLPRGVSPRRQPARQPTARPGAGARHGCTATSDAGHGQHQRVRGRGQERAHARPCGSEGRCQPPPSPGDAAHAGRPVGVRPPRPHPTPMGTALARTAVGRAVPVRARRCPGAPRGRRTAHRRKRRPTVRSGAPAGGSV